MSPRNPRSWRQRQRLALLINASLAGAAFLVAALSSHAEDWRPALLFLVLALFAIASELMAIPLRHTATPQGTGTRWLVTSSAPYVLAAVLLGPLPGVAIALAALTVGLVISRPPFHDAVANLAIYGVYLVSSALLAGWVIESQGVSSEDALFPFLVVAIYAWGVVVSFAINAGYGALSYGESIRDIARNEWRLQVRVEISIALSTGLTAYAYASAGIGALAVLVALQLIFVDLTRGLHQSDERAAALKRHATRIAELSASRGRLVGEILTAEEGERRRLAEALHDEAMQNLLAARQDLAARPGAMDVERARAALECTIDQLRDAIFELHPVVLEQVGLVAAVEAVANRAARRGGFDVTVNVSRAAVGERELLLFTISRELLANAAEHANATSVAISLHSLDDMLTIEVTDDGQGLDCHTLRSALEEGHVGLASTRERIEALGGTFEIESERGAGTTVRAHIPHSNGTGRKQAEAAPRLITHNASSRVLEAAP